MKRFVLLVSLRELNGWYLNEFDFGLDAFSSIEEFLDSMGRLPPAELLFNLLRLSIEEPIGRSTVCVMVVNERTGCRYELPACVGFDQNEGICRDLGC